jgi:AcrR family transcriptional regulator
MIRIKKKPEERRREIVSASRDLFLRKGYENTTMQDVMATLLIAKGTVYHYFKSKEALLEAVVDDMVSEYLAVVEKSLNNFRGTALDTMRVLIAAGRIAPDQLDTLNAIHTSGNTELHLRLLAVTISRLAPLYAKVISQGCEEGVFCVDHPLECAEMVLAGVQFLTDIGCYPWHQHDLQRRVRSIPSLIENQLRAPKGAFSFLLEHNGCKQISIT